MTKTTTIILDRLAAALGRHGVKLRRQQLLGVAADAFGYRNDNALSAAVADGKFDPPLATRTGTTADGLALHTDPVAGRAFAFDHGALAGRGGEWVASPYGNLLAIDRSEGPAMDVVPAPAKVKVHVATVSHRHGMNLYTATTAEALEAELAQYCDEWWSEVRDRDSSLPETTEGMKDADIVEAYFEAHEDEFLERFESVDIDVASAPSAPAAAPPAGSAPSTAKDPTGGWIAMRLDLEHDEPVAWWSERGGWGPIDAASVYEAPDDQIDAGEGASVEWQKLPDGRDVVVEWEADTSPPPAVTEACAAVGRTGIQPLPGLSLHEAEPQLRREAGERIVRRVVISGFAADDVDLAAWSHAVRTDLRRAGGEVVTRGRTVTIALNGDGDAGQAATPADWLRAVADLLAPVEGRDRIMADFAPEAWVNDNAVETDDGTPAERLFDVTYEMLLAGREDAALFTSAENDHLIEAVRAPRWIRGWSGPFTIRTAQGVADAMHLFD